ncbi:DUF5719 family protein [Aeromicrobium wangtongii]|uniref:DUF5719 family protein n=1 Tax=Aeromicrobium wangtongii TaxID=2969247 RepID=A0ABY5MCW0_9ACTN|nr:DUF5719 family protein [Aeromicrobium wangtongii]MCD9197061.1 DUF5719 family protein [Aeromicrobium wangtongii]UUP14562.1 DUF5719 family protein [Aeromicrobium wangtongii]
MTAADLRAAALPVVAIVLVVLATLAPSGADRAKGDRAPGTVEVTRSAYACPAGSAITVAAGQVTAGTSGTASVLPAMTPDGRLGGATSWRTGVVDAPGVLVEQAGRGSGAVGYFAGTAPRSGGGGLVVGPCPGVVDDAWLLGLGSGSKHFSTLILTNLGDTRAAVDLTLWGPAGEIDAVDAKGVVIEPHSVNRIPLDSLAAGESEVAVRVQRLRGSVSAVVNDTSTATFKGTEPISVAQGPSREQIVGGVVGGTSGRTLLVLNPGTSTARVDVQVIGPEGTFTPAGLEQVTVEAGTLRAVTVPRTAGSPELALRLTSDQPISSTVRMAPTTADYAYAEPTVPLTGPAVVPVDLGAASGVPQLVLTAPGPAATVEIQAFDAQMAPLMSSTVEIGAGATQVAGVDAEGAAYLVLRPKGQVIAAATYTKGKAISSLAVQDAPVSVIAPQVRPAG